jgi:hypothetical protein
MSYFTLRWLPNDEYAAVTGRSDNRIRFQSAKYYNVSPRRMYLART